MFNQKDYKSMEISLLKKLCKNIQIKGYSKFKKKELFDAYNKTLAVNTIQHCYRKHFYKEAIDHITLEEVTYPCFIYKTKSGKIYFYNHDSIIKYIMKTAIYRDPMTREEYSDEVLKRLDSEAKFYYPNIKYRSTYKIKKNLSYARRIRNRENEILSFQLRMDELKELIFFIVNSDMCNWNIGNEPLLIENVEYQTVDSFIQSVINELKMVLVNLRNYDTHTADIFKIDLIQNLQILQNFQQFNYFDLITGI